MVDQFNRNNHKQEEIDRCLKLIQSRNPRDRSYAAKRLGEMKVRPDVLMSMMVDPNGFVRSASAEALGRSVELPAPEVISHLLAAIDDPNNYVCAAAVNSLGLLDAKQAVNQVEACLEDSHPIERIEDKLVDYLQSDEYLIHLAATRACGWLMHQACGELVLKALQNFIENNDQHDPGWIRERPFPH